MSSSAQYQYQGVHVKIGDFGLAAPASVSANVLDDNNGGGSHRRRAEEACIHVSMPESNSREVDQKTVLSSSRQKSKSSNLRTYGIGTASYGAPEQLNSDGSGFYGPAADIFPLGLILMELCCLFTTGQCDKLQNVVDDMKVP